MQYMLDTNIISYIAEGNNNVIDNLSKCMLAGNDIAISTVAYYEVKRGLLYNNSVRKMNAFLKCVKQIDVIPITNDISECAAEIYAYLRQEGKLIEDSDIFIGATALVNNAIIVTNNEEHLGRIRGLRIENWTNVE